MFIHALGIEFHLEKGMLHLKTWLDDGCVFQIEPFALLEKGYWAYLMVDQGKNRANLQIESANGRDCYLCVELNQCERMFIGEMIDQYT